jgi:single-strand DNA-binding protein
MSILLRIIMSQNKVFLHGFVGIDPELKILPDGKSIARFTLATTETWKNQAGEKQSKTEWHNIVAWNKQAEVVEKNIKKGTELIVIGKIQYTPNKENPKQWYTHIRLTEFDFCGKKDGGSRQSTPDPDYSGPEYNKESSDDLDQSTPSGSGSSMAPDDDIPF